MLVSNFKDRYRKDSISRRKLMVAGICLTNRCNLNCVHCYIREDAGQASQREMNTGEIVRLVREIRSENALHMNITGGEPLLRPDFEEIYRSAKRNNFAVNVLTNATLLTDRMVAMFKKDPPHLVDVSCYGVTKKTAESVTRVAGSFEQFQRALRRLKKSGLNVVLKFITMKSNYREAPQAEALAKEMGMHYRCFYYLWHRLDRDPGKNARIDRERLNADETIRLFRSIREDIGRFFLSDECGFSSSCGAASIGCICDPYGMVMPCSFLRERGVSALKIGFKRAWDLLASDRMPSKMRPKACGGCRHAAYCKWCAGACYLETGCTDEKLPYLCKLMDDLYEKKAVGCR